MDPQAYRRLLEEIHALREEKKELQLGQLALQRRLERQGSSAQQLRGQLADERQINEQLRDQLAKQGTAQKELQEKLNDQEAVNTALQMQLDDQQSSNFDLQMQLIDQDVFNKDLKTRLETAKGRMSEAVERAEDITLRYHAALAYTREAVTRANVAVRRANAEMARTDEAEVQNEVLAEENHSLYNDLMDAEDEISIVGATAEAAYLEADRLFAENIRLRATQAGVFRRVRNDTHEMASSDEEDD
ncbi:hypothetical protein PG997_008801 [Apiospora hydei]|uniref:Uncharacterized protein n=1 Tax=Apiospora hydei TaxID=1337664 RepID=A0ABR1WBU7_9PEZI